MRDFSVSAELTGAPLEKVLISRCQHVLYPPDVILAAYLAKSTSPCARPILLKRSFASSFEDSAALLFLEVLAFGSCCEW